MENATLDLDGERERRTFAISLLSHTRLSARARFCKLAEVARQAKILDGVATCPNPTAVIFVYTLYSVHTRVNGLRVFLPAQCEMRQERMELGVWVASSRILPPRLELISSGIKPPEQQAELSAKKSAAG